MKISKINKKYFFFSFLIVTSLLVTDFALADAYELQVPLGEVTSVEVGSGISGLASYLAIIYKIAIGAVGIVAVVVMILGGFLWITAFGNGERVGRAKSYITAALSGLVLALCSWTILWMVNPALVSFKSSEISSPQTPASSGEGCCSYASARDGNGSLTTARAETSKEADCIAPGVFMDNSIVEGDHCVAYQASDADIRLELEKAMVTINKPNCTSPEQTSCTSLTKLPLKAVEGLKKIAAGTGKWITVTGGTEKGHSEHGQGLAVVDLRLCSKGCGDMGPNLALLSYIHDAVGLGFGEAMKKTEKGQKTIRYTATDGSFDVIREVNTDNSQHFHIRFK